MRHWLLAAAIAGLAGQSAANVQTCDRDLIVSLSEEILERRGDLQGFAGGRIGGDAAYFALRYGDADPNTVGALLGEGRAFRQADDLLLAQRIADFGPGAELFWGVDPREAVIGGHWHVRRAILLLDEGETFFRIVRQIREDPELSERFDERWIFGSNLHAILTDQSPATLEAIAVRAEAAGEVLVAASLYALLPQGAFEDFWSRNQDSDAPGIRLAEPLNMNYNGTFALARDYPYVLPDDSAEARFNRLNLFVAFKGSLFEAGGAVLGIGLNQTGRTQEFAFVANVFLTAIEAGEIDPARRPEEGWAFLLGRLQGSLGWQETSELLSSFDLAADRRHYAGRAKAVLEMAVAAEAVGPWLRGETDTPPERPESLSFDFDWDGSLTAWALIREGRRLPPLEADAPLLPAVIEGYIQRGEVSNAMAQAEASGGLQRALRVAQDVIRRQNRLCDQHGILPGSPLLLGGQLIYDFQ